MKALHCAPTHSGALCRSTAERRHGRTRPQNARLKALNRQYMGSCVSPGVQPVACGKRQEAGSAPQGPCAWRAPSICPRPSRTGRADDARRGRAGCAAAPAAPFGGPARAVGDNEASLLRRAGDALMLNARGHVPVGIGIRGGRVAISVGDAGIGIAPDRLEAVFEPIGRADGSITRRFVPPDLREAAEAGNARGGRARRGGGVRDIPVDVFRPVSAASRPSARSAASTVRGDRRPRPSSRLPPMRAVAAAWSPIFPSGSSGLPCSPRCRRYAGRREAVRRVGRAVSERSFRRRA